MFFILGISVTFQHYQITYTLQFLAEFSEWNFNSRDHFMLIPCQVMWAGPTVLIIQRFSFCLSVDSDHRSWQHIGNWDFPVKRNTWRECYIKHLFGSKINSSPIYIGKHKNWLIQPVLKASSGVLNSNTLQLLFSYIYLRLLKKILENYCLLLKI